MPIHFRGLKPCFFFFRHEIDIMGSSQAFGAHGVNSDFPTHIPVMQSVKSHRGVKQIELQNCEASASENCKPHEVIHLETFGTRGKAAVSYDGVAALQLEGSKAKLKGKLPSQPLLVLLSPGNGTNAAATSSEPGSCISTDRTTPELFPPGNGKNTVIVSSEPVDSISTVSVRSYPTTADFFPGNGKSTFSYSETGHDITIPPRKSSQSCNTYCISGETCPPSMLPCLRCRSTNTEFWFYDISSNEPRYFCEDCRLLSNVDVSALDLYPMVNRAPRSGEISIDMPPENESASNTHPGDSTTRTTSTLKAFVDAARPWVERVLGDPRLVGILIMVNTEAGLALVACGSSPNTSMTSNAKILLDIAGVSIHVGFLCCLYILLLRRVKPGGSLIFSGFGFIAAVIGFLAIMGIHWSEHVKLYVTATLASMALLTALAHSFFK